MIKHEMFEDAKGVIRTPGYSFGIQWPKEK
jgi:hypothetical protein